MDRTWYACLTALQLTLAASWLLGCTTYVTPVACTGGAFRCNERRDVKFCHYEAVEVEGADCASVGLAASKPFCVVEPSFATSACGKTDYEVSSRDCRVVSYRTLEETSECIVGAPVFTP
jgi:hypothetical protein